MSLDFHLRLNFRDRAKPVELISTRDDLSPQGKIRDAQSALQKIDLDDLQWNINKALERHADFVSRNPEITHLPAIKGKIDEFGTSLEIEPLIPDSGLQPLTSHVETLLNRIEQGFSALRILRNNPEKLTEKNIQYLAQFRPEYVYRPCPKSIDPDFPVHKNWGLSSTMIALAHGINFKLGSDCLPNGSIQFLDHCGGLSDVDQKQYRSICEVFSLSAEKRSFERTLENSKKEYVSYRVVDIADALDKHIAFNQKPEPAKLQPAR